MDQDQQRLEALRARLNEIHEWPSVYMFKFVIPTKGNGLTELKAIFGESAEYALRESKNGNYVSVTIKQMMLDADAIFERYTRASTIPGIISL